LEGDLQFAKFLKNTICIGLCKLKCTEKRFIPLTPLLFLPEFVPHTEFKGRPEMPSRMYSTIQLLEIMRRSAFTSPLSYPFLLGVYSSLAKNSTKSQLITRSNLCHFEHHFYYDIFLRVPCRIREYSAFSHVRKGGERRPFKFLQDG